MRRIGAWPREKPARLYWLAIALLLSNIFVLILGPRPPKLSLLVATVVAILVLAYANGREGRSQ